MSDLCLVHTSKTALLAPEVPYRPLSTMEPMTAKEYTASMRLLDSQIKALKQFVGRHEQDQLLQNRKLVLLVDLDLTLLHTRHATGQTPEGAFSFELEPGKWYETRLRPHTNTFLENMSKLFEMRICTLATREYANKMTTFLDKYGHYFGNRITSREDLEYTSKVGALKKLYPVGDNLVVIIDDTKKVWGSAPNLIDVKPYVFFGNGNINHSNDGDDYLLHLQSTLRKIHRDFFRAYDANVGKEQVKLPHAKNFLPKCRRRMLSEPNFEQLKCAAKRSRNCNEESQQPFLCKRRRTTDDTMCAQIGLA